MIARSHQGLYRSLALVLGGLLGSIVLLFAGIAGAMPTADAGARRAGRVRVDLRRVCAGLAAPASLDDRCRCRADRRTAAGAMMGRRRVRRVPFGAIASLSNVQNGADELLALTTRDGERFVLPPVRAPSDGLVPKPDQEGLDAFAARLQAAMTAAGVPRRR